MKPRLRPDEDAGVDLGSEFKKKSRILLSFFALYSILIFSVEMALHWYFLLFPSWLDLPGTNPVPAFFSILLRGPLVPRNCLQSLPTLIRILFLSRRCASGRQSGLAGCLST